MYQHEPHGSRRRSLTAHQSERRKRKDSNGKLTKLSTTQADQTTKHRRSSSHANKTSPKPEFDDARLFCDDCNQFYENICPYHKQSYIPDRKVSAALRRTLSKWNEPISRCRDPCWMMISKKPIWHVRGAWWSKHQRSRMRAKACLSRSN